MNYTFFGIQVVIPDLALRGELEALVVAAPREMTLVDKRELYTKIGDLLEPRAASFAFGYWDYIADASHAETEFDTWCSELEKTVGQEIGSPPAQGAYRTASTHFLFTMAFLLPKGGTSDTTVAERCDLPESAYFTRAAFARLVSIPKMLAFASVRADAVYLVPGDDRLALTVEDLRGEGYEYLRPLA